MSTFVMSSHATRQALAMGLEGPEIREAVLNPRFVGRTNNGRVMQTRGKVSVVIAETAPPTVVTVLWATAAAWANDEDTIHSRSGERQHEHQQAIRRARKSQKRRTRGRGF